MRNADRLNPVNYLFLGGTMCRVFFAIAALVLILSSMVSAAPDAITVAQSYCVVNSSGVPIVGALVKLGDIGVQTDNNGIANLTGIKIGDYDLRVEAKGYIAVKKPIAVRGFIPQTKIVLDPWPNVIFEVNCAEGAAIGADVSLNGETRSADPRGKVQFGSLQPGDYDYVVTMPGCISKKGVLKLSSKNVIQKIQLADRGQVRFQVLDASNNMPLKNVTIDLVAYGQKISKTTSNDGKVIFTDMPVGKYQYSATLKGFYHEEGALVLDSESMDQKLALSNRLSDVSLTVVGTEATRDFTGATVKMNNVTKNVDESGKVVFERVPFGSILFTIECNNYQNYNGVFYVAKPTESASVQIRHKVGTVKVEVTDNAGPLKNTIVHIIYENNSGLQFFATTDAKGRVNFVNVPYGRYDCTLESNGWKQKVQQLVINQPEVSLNFNTGSVR